MITILTGVRGYVLHFFLMIRDVEHLFMFVGHLYVFLGKRLFKSSVHILVGLLVFDVKLYEY